MNVRYRLAWAWLVLNVVLGLVACTKGTSSENQIASEYSLSFSPESPSILEEVTVTLQGPPSRSAHLELRGPDGAPQMVCQDSAQSSELLDAGTRKFSCVFQQVGTYRFTAFVDSFSNGEKSFSAEIRVGNAQRFVLNVSQGSEKSVFKSSLSTSEGTGQFVTDAPIDFNFEDGGESATIVFADGSRHAGPQFSHTFSEGGPQPFRVELRNAAGEIRVNRELTLVLHCNGNTVPPVELSDLTVVALANGAYRYTPLATSGQIAGFKLDVNGDGAMDTPWVKTASRDEYAMLVGTRRLSGVAMNRCGDSTAFNYDRNLEPSVPGPGTSYLRSKVEGIDNDEISANVNPFLALSSEGTVGQRRYTFGFSRHANPAGGENLRVVAEHDYILGSNNPHAIRIDLPLPASLIPALEGSKSGDVTIAAQQFEYQTAKEGDNVIGRLYTNAEPMVLHLTIEKTKKSGGACAQSGVASNRYELLITGVWEGTELTESIATSPKKRVKVEGQFVLHEGNVVQNDTCTPAPTCRVTKLGSFIHGVKYDGNYYPGIEARAQLEVFGQATNVTFQGNPAVAGTQIFTPSAATSNFSMEATVSGPGGTSTCGPSTAVNTAPGASCVLEVPASTMAGSTAAAAATLRVNNMMLHGEGLTVAEITHVESGSKVSVLSSLAQPPAVTSQHLVGSMSIPVPNVSPYNFTAKITAADGSTATCGGGGNGTAKPAPSCVIYGNNQPEVGTPTTYTMQVNYVGLYDSGYWSASVSGSGSGSGSAVAVPSSQNGAANFSLTFPAIGSANISAAVSYTDNGVSKSFSCGLPVTVQAIPLDCVVSISDNQSVLYLNDTRTISLYAVNGNRLGGVKSATLNGVNVLSSMSVSQTFNTLSAITFNGRVETNDGQVKTCGATFQARAKPLSCSATSSSTSLNHLDSATVRIHSIQNLDQHGGALTSAKIGGVEVASLSDLQRVVQFLNPSGSTRWIDVAAQITAVDGTTVQCPGAGANVAPPPVPDNPPPPTSTCKLYGENGLEITASSAIRQNVTFKMFSTNATTGYVVTPNGRVDSTSPGLISVVVPASALPYGNVTFSGSATGPGGTVNCQTTKSFWEPG